LPEAAVTCRGLTRSFGRVGVLRGLDLELERGASMALLGANGSGKTTLLRLLAGLLRADGGNSSVLGHQLPSTAVLRRKLGYLGHESWLYGELSARENLEFYCRLYGVSDDRPVDSLLERVGMTRAASRRVRSFSRGMVQRLSLARALLHNPQLLLLDEPFTGLDRDGVELLENLVAEQRAAGTSILMVTHDLARVSLLADQAVLLGRGRVAWQGQGNDLAPERLEQAWRDMASGQGGSIATNGGTQTC
jgi:heme exporter protein A